MQLTKVEINETHIIVTTPEKWDVITRKSDDLVKIVKLLIVDEVHLLIRLVEQSQFMIRIVGLSTTLPNHKDVAAFLSADNGILYFGNEYLPVPSSETFISVRDNNKLREKLIDEGHQVMIFVQSRKQTTHVHFQWKINLK